VERAHPECCRKMGIRRQRSPYDRHCWERLIKVRRLVLRRLVSLIVRPRSSWTVIPKLWDRCRLARTP